MSTLGNPPLGASVWSVLPSHWTWTTTTSSSFCESGCLICLILRQILVNHYCRFLIFHTVSICGNIKIVGKEVLSSFHMIFWAKSGHISPTECLEGCAVASNQVSCLKVKVKVDTFVNCMSRSYIFFHCPIHFILYSKCNWSKGVQWL